MNTSVSRLPLPAPLDGLAPPYKQLGRHLVDQGHISSTQLVDALEMQLGAQVPLGEILVASGLVSASTIADLVARQHALCRVDLIADPPDPELVELLPAEFWLRRRAV